MRNSTRPPESSASFPIGFPIGSWRRRLAITRIRSALCGLERSHPEKGLDFLFEIAEVLPSRPDWSWDVFGDGLVDGRTPEECQAEARARGMGDQLRFCGSVPNLIERYQHFP